MAQPLADQGKRHAGLDHVCRRTVPEVVEPHVADPGMAKDALPRPLQAAGIHSLTDQVGEDR